MYTSSQITKEQKEDSGRMKLLRGKCLYMYETNKPFTLIKQGSAYDLQSNFFNARAVRNIFTSKDRLFIKSVKDYVVKNNIVDKFIMTDYGGKKINYIDVKKFNEGDVVDDVDEIDIDKAYWITAYQLGIINKKLFDLGMGDEIGKIVRLAALGSLAKKIDKWVFNGKKMYKMPTERNYATENLWFAICKRVSDVMGGAAKIAGEDFIFYWVDGIYIKRNEKKKKQIQDYFTSLGYTSKTSYIPKIEFNDYSFMVQGTDASDKREFTYPAGNRIKSIRQYNEDIKLLAFAEEFYLGRCA